MIPWYAWAILASLFATAFSITRKKALLKEHAMNFESIRTFLLALISLCMLPWMDWSLDGYDIGVIYFCALISTVGILYAAKALRHNDISLISPLDNLRPAFVAILATIFLSESLVWHQILGIAILVISAYILESDHHFSSLLAPLKHLIGSRYSAYFLLAIFIFSITSLIDKYLVSVRNLNIYTYFFLVWLFIAINFNIIHAYRYGFEDLKKCVKHTKFLVLWVAVLSFFSNFLALKAISMAYVSLAIPVIMSSTLLIVLIGGKFFKEKYLGFRMVVSLMMLVGAYLVII